MIVMFWSRVLIVCLVLLSTALRFANFILFSIPSLFSHLVTVWIVFSSMYARWAWKVVYGIKFELWFLGGWLPFSLPQSFVVLRWHRRLALICEVLLTS
ncbi:BnaCnng45810D [Brassica napus]|uniref:BnaCnng45810D protein n=1 Tax=Brassica napus TaxID=3708 RepID=A0A078JH90_BRANA|nr:BnaCnng45810D [Brassica napus]